MGQKTSTRAQMVRAGENVPPSIVVEWGSCVFCWLEKITLNRLIACPFTRSLPRGQRLTQQYYGYLFRDIWNLLFLLSAVLLTLVVAPIFPAVNIVEPVPILKFLIVWRIYEVGVLQTNVMLFDHYRVTRDALDTGARLPSPMGAYILRGYARRVLEALLNYIEVVFWFALLYFSYRDNFEVPVDALRDSVEIYLLASLQVLSGFGSITPVTRNGVVLVIVHSALGIFLTVMVISFTISLLGNINFRSVEPTEQEPHR